MSDVNKQQRWFLIALSTLTGVLVLAGVLAATNSLFSYYTWVGSKQLPVHVLVLNRESLQPVTGAEVVLFTGPHSPFDGPISRYNRSDVSPKHENAESQQARTDEEGRAVLSRRFFAAGSEGLFKHTGYVDTSNVWVQVSTDDYASITLPLDGQSFRRRDIDDETPVYVTLLLTKVKAAKTSR